MGKSTLAQYVYNDKRVEEYFDVRMWVCISRKLDVCRHTEEIFESATKGECPRLDNLDTLQGKLIDKLQESGKFLLVLDDIWFDDSNNQMEWDQLLAPLVSQQAGSKVLVTSRRDTFSSALCCSEVVFRLENMEDSQFLALFKYHAFSEPEIRDPQLREKQEEVAEKIIKRLGKSPLAAKVVGSQLNGKTNISAWKDALTIQIDNLSEPGRALLWSYEKLDPRIQRCFLYCSLFPKGHKYDIEELVPLWVAEGFVNSCNMSKRMEDIGRDYFNEMVSVSFFQPVWEGYTRTPHVMHDLLHDLAESLSKQDCFRLEDDKVTEIPCTVRHLSVRVESMKQHKQSICRLHHLRTVICIDPVTDDINDVFNQILQRLKKLRVLYLSFYNKSKLPESIGELKHLRYLNIIRSLVSELPRSLCITCNFFSSVIKSIVCLSMLEGLPSNIDLFSNCCSLVLKNVPNLKILPCLPASIKKLKIKICPLLTFISNYELGQHDQSENIKRTDHVESELASVYEVSQPPTIFWKVLSSEHSSFKQLIPLIDTGTSSHLQTIGNALGRWPGEILDVKEDIIKAWICCHKQSIRLIYAGTAELPLVLPSRLCELTLSSCNITDGALAVCLDGLTLLKRLSLSKVMTLTTLSSQEVLQYSTKLCNLKIKECWCLRSLRGIRAATSLEHLRLASCPSLELSSGAEIMPLSLQCLEIRECMLAADFFCGDWPHLTYIFIWGCRSTPTLSFGSLTSLEDLSLYYLPDLCTLEGLASLQLHSLVLTNVPSLTTECISQFRVQKSLQVSSSVMLNHMLSAEGFTVPPRLNIIGCKEPSISFEESANFTSVVWLQFYMCEMRSLPTNLKCFSSLTDLQILHCYNISSLPDLPPSLRRIRIVNCGLLEKSCRAPDGESWPKIAHIRWKAT
ncbi:unnamed protein product [Triticum aestivum]|uniref:Uncharacterized protein n=1 Tax=Triticum aestivum TaxID=4565 RepID=A0A7H4LQK4_WHEAT|nr:unnamed protein product [Triticum aestivum]